MYCSPFSLIAYFTKFICVCYRINLTGGQWKKAVKRKSINQWSRVAAGIVRFCMWIVVCWTCLGLPIKKLAVLPRSVSGGFRRWLQKPLRCWALDDFEALLSLGFQWCSLAKRATYILLWLGENILWQNVYFTKTAVGGVSKRNFGKISKLIIGKGGLNLVSNDLFWKVKVFSLKLFGTKGYYLFNVEMIC